MGFQKLNEETQCNRKKEYIVNDNFLINDFLQVKILLLRLEHIDVYW